VDRRSTFDAESCAAWCASALFDVPRLSLLSSRCPSGCVGCASAAAPLPVPPRAAPAAAAAEAAASAPPGAAAVSAGPFAAGTAEGSSTSGGGSCAVGGLCGLPPPPPAGSRIGDSQLSAGSSSPKRDGSRAPRPSLQTSGRT